MKRYDCALFSGMTETEYDGLTACLNPREEIFKRGASAYRYDGGEKIIAFVVDGVAKVVKIDESGNEILLERLVKGSVFGNAVSYGEKSEDYVVVVAETDCKVVFVKFESLIVECNGECSFKHKLLLNVIEVMRRKTSAIGERTEIIGNRSTRDKLLCYFSSLCAKSGGNRAKLEMSLTSLSEYICSDRSAMMREIRKLKDEGVLTIDRKTVELHK